MTNAPNDLLYACLRGERDQALRILRQQAWSWEALFESASEEALLPYLHSSLRGLDILSKIPAEIADFLSNVEAANRERNAAMITEAQAAIALMGEIGIRPVLLKGLAYLATGVYRDPGQRFLYDADFLVPEGRRQEVVDHFQNKGWEYAEDVHPSRISALRGIALRRSGVMVEFHSRLGAATCERVLPAATVLEGASPVGFQGAEVLVPTAEHLIIHVILHSQVHHSYDWRIWAPLRCMVDLVQITGRFGAVADWASIESAFSRAGEYRTLALHLRQVRDSLSMPLPLPIRGSALLELAWRRRKALQRIPQLRFVDPYYMYWTVLSDRVKNVRHILRTGHGVRYLLSHAFDPRVYARFWADVIQGRGR